MKYFIGIDGGGSKTELILGDIEGNIIKHTRGENSNPAFAGALKACENISNLLYYSLSGIDLYDITFISVCIPGIRNYWMKIDILKKAFDEGKVEISGDEENSFYGALAKECGIVILSGTGSFAMGINEKGEKLTVGGWGPLLWDEGSGYFVGIRAIKAAINQYENLGKETILYGEVLEHFGIKDINMLKSVLYKEEFNIKQIAALSKSVLKGAVIKDNICLQIIDETAGYLFNMADIVIKRLNMKYSGYDLCLTGGINNFGDYIIEPLSNRVKERYKNISVVKPLFTPCVGSLILSYRKKGIKVSESIIKNLKTSYEEVNLDVIK